MKGTRRKALAAAAAGLAAWYGESVFAQRGRGRGRGRGGPPPWAGRPRDEAHEADHALIQQLLEHRGEIVRQVKPLENGVETITETENAALREVLVKHVQAMKARVEEGRPIHLRDPLFYELFRRADEINLRYELTETGVHVWETSEDPQVVRLIQAHAEVVNQFLAKGRREVRRNHAVPGDAAIAEPR